MTLGESAFLKRVPVNSGCALHERRGEGIPVLFVRERKLSDECEMRQSGDEADGSAAERAGPPRSHNVVALTCVLHGQMSL